MFITDFTMKEVLEKIQSAIEAIDYGEIIINLRESSDVIDIKVQNSIRVLKKMD